MALPLGAATEYVMTHPIRLSLFLIFASTAAFASRSDTADVIPVSLPPEPPALDLSEKRTPPPLVVVCALIGPGTKSAEIAPQTDLPEGVTLPATWFDDLCASLKAS